MRDQLEALSMQKFEFKIVVNHSVAPRPISWHNTSTRLTRFHKFVTRGARFAARRSSGILRQLWLNNSSECLCWLILGFTLSIYNIYNIYTQQHENDKTQTVNKNSQVDIKWHVSRNWFSFCLTQHLRRYVLRGQSDHGKLRSGITIVTSHVVMIQFGVFPPPGTFIYPSAQLLPPHSFYFRRNKWKYPRRKWK